MDTSHTADICRQMNEVRYSMGDDVEEFVESARTLTNWRHYVRTHPWLCLASAAAMAYLAVPNRLETIRPSADVLEELARRNKLVVEPNMTLQTSSGLGSAIFSMLAKAAIRGATSFAAQHASKRFASAATPADADKGDKHAESNR